MRKLLQLLAVGIALGVLFVNCGSPSSSGDGFGAVNTPSNDPNPADQTKLTSCSKNIVAYDTSSGSRVPTTDISVQVQRYKDQTGTVRDDLMRLKFVTAPSAQWMSENWDLEIYRWIASPSGSNLDTTNLSFQFERKVGSNAQLVSPNQYIFFDWTDLRNMTTFVNSEESSPAFANFPTDVSDASPIAFFNEMNLLINTRDTTNSYQVMRVVLRNGTTKQSVREIEVLIPAFAADPARYAADTRHPLVLQDLHPLKGQSGYTQLQFQALGHASCFLPGAI
jgi:hypothetical protein